MIEKNMIWPAIISLFLSTKSKKLKHKLIFISSHVEMILSSSLVEMMLETI
jgi:hypothetical protein